MRSSSQSMIIGQSGIGGSPRRSISGTRQGYSRPSTGMYSSGLGGIMGLGLGGASYGGFSSGGSSVSGMSMAGGSVKNEKETMINLNNRLSTYLQKVKDLESANTRLELQLKEFQVGKALTGIDYDAYDVVIKPLREQILALLLGNARLALDLDNASLAATDFSNKYENELCIRQSVAADIDDLKGMKTENIMNYKDLESDIASGKDELAYLKKNHDEELALLRQQVTGTVSVNVEAGPSVDMALEMQKLRDEYETYCAKNQQDLDKWYHSQVNTQVKETVQVNEAVESGKLQIVELRKQMQPLEIECNSLMSGNASMEACIQDIHDKYQGKLQNLQMTICQLEGELIRIRNEMKQKVTDYDALLCIKMELETDIATYRSLLEGSNISLGQTGSDTRESSGTVTTVKTETRSMTYK
ncbi:keratin, type I cytoskeletal 13-like [Scyliorhinus canicula]|uniref:keratin, type I cytoskeletal 13-like n=1 Tax=Scyliorhinus canicula TaxID=7830 RepID=UPI0018F3F2AC|nr:keratin, type I cytoskeletal 13-like [Scyliorhinus canicula]